MEKETLITLREIFDEDTKAQASLGYKNIPKGATVELLGRYRNMYGEFVKVKYHGNIYATKDEYLRSLEELVQSIPVTDTMQTARIYTKTALIEYLESVRNRMVESKSKSCTTDKDVFTNAGISLCVDILDKEIEVLVRLK